MVNGNAGFAAMTSGILSLLQRCATRLVNMEVSANASTLASVSQDTSVTAVKQVFFLSGCLSFFLSSSWLFLVVSINIVCVCVCVCV